MVFQPLKAALLDMKGFPFPQSNLTIQASSSLLPLIKKSFYSTTSIFIHFFVHHENHILDHYVLMMLSNDQILYHLSKLKWWNSITRTSWSSVGRLCITLTDLLQTFFYKSSKDYMIFHHDNSTVNMQTSRLWVRCANVCSTRSAQWCSRLFYPFLVETQVFYQADGNMLLFYWSHKSSLLNLKFILW